MRLIGISVLYLPLLHIDVISASLQVLFLGILNIFFYLDRRWTVLALTAAMVVANGVFTWGTLMLGPNTYGYGFALALLVVVVVAMQLLDRRLDALEYETYMLQQQRFGAALGWCAVHLLGSLWMTWLGLQSVGMIWPAARA